MCGIAGFYQTGNSGLSSGQQESVWKQLADRGPDGRGSRQIGPLTLFHTRLGIIAPGPEGNQPFTGSDARYTLVFNGEILNHTALRAKLQATGQAFKTGSDTEVLWAGLKNEGVSFLKKVRGFFALAFYDAQTDTLLLARDHAGIKPLMYGRDGRGFCFASVAPAILVMGYASVPDAQSLAAYLEFHFIPPERSMWSGISPLAPGHYLILEKGILQETGSWQEAATTTLSPVSDAEFESALQESLKRNLVADTDAGIFLSGGLDSSLLALGIHRQQALSLRAFTLTSRNAYLDEGKRASELAQSLGWKWIPVELEADTALKWLEAMPEPIGDPAAIGTFRLSEVASSEVKWVVSGDGADELTGGYLRYAAWSRSVGLHLPQWFPVWHGGGDRESLWSDTWRKISRLIRLLQIPEAGRYRYLCSFREKDSVARWMRADEAYAFPQTFPYPTAYDSQKVAFADFRFLLPGNMLPKTDLSGMAAGLEIRVPYLDEDLVRLSGRLSHTQRTGKAILHTVWRNWNGRAFPYPKRGLDLPLREVFSGKVKEKWHALTTDRVVAETGLFRKGGIPEPGSTGMSLEKAWALLAWLDVWHRTVR